ncbi:E3 ubiquitin-protein ligase PRT6 [Rhododendron vialii]|uniref:E3 ubiquitin-protein ligase PRT6 n=1 Tax=Rhododendron vialii TaxID=182163 RepID=UPI00265FE73F|nr:E3 ubiquitin-protein ligase PRT6 [Rhododendron vialii]XP_058215169.1 E3 ubiquitin-protein ligase PRT6 [Rhododendron vialii]XP_058215170.1 E3 ubiquitin-protein ligase PRT6 [Rhododendron vialii]
MFKMEIDSPPDVEHLSPQDRIVQALSVQGVPDENLEKLQAGLVAFLKDNKFLTPDMVYAILDTDDEAVGAMTPTLADHFEESMVWLRWLMFEGEPASALKKLAKMSVGQRGVCGAVWGNNDIAYRCRTCEHDPTCAICVPCFKNGNHTDHDYSIIYTGGGCCDCGDVTAWKREGFCSNHKGAEQIQPLAEEFANSVGPILDLLLDCWKNKLKIAETLSQQSSGVEDRIAEFRKVADGFTAAVVQMLLEFCNCSESLLSFISGRILSSLGLLDILVRAEKFLGKDFPRKLHELLLKLLAEPRFKYDFATAFLNYYPTVVGEAVKECNDDIFKKYQLLSTFSVQIFTVPTLTPRLVKEKNLLVLLLECLDNIFVACAGDDGRLQVTKWGNLYETTLRVVEDIRFVMSHAIVPKYVTHDRQDILRMWMRLLAFVQGMNPQKRETGIHIEEDNENMHLPFVLGHSIANIHSLLVAGAFSVSSTGVTDDEILSTTYEEDCEDRDSPRHAKVGRLSQESSVCSATVRSGTLGSASKVAEAKSDLLVLQPSVASLVFECLKAIENWLRVDNTSGALLSILSPKIANMSGNNFFTFKKTLSKIRKGKSIFRSYNATSAGSKLTRSGEIQGRDFSLLAHSGFRVGIDIENGQVIGQDASVPASDDNTMEVEYATELDGLRFLTLPDWPDAAYDVSSQEISVHIPLHRLVSLVLQKSLKRCYGESSLPDTISVSPADSSSAVYQDFFGHVLGGCHPYGFSGFAMEHPLRIRVFCAQVRAGMWRKNGDAAILSWEWYRSVRWSEQGLELDLLLLQCCAALAPADLYVSRILERFGLSSYLSLNPERSSEYEPVLVHEMLTLIIQIVKERRFCGLSTAECLERELVYKLAIGDATHSQLVKSLPRDLNKMKQLQKILDTVASYSSPSGMNQGMYKLRLQYWKELDLYHPRWNSRDLQVAEERYLRYCGASALNTQLPKWSKIFSPLSGVARVATCKMVIQIVRAVLFYAVYPDKATASRAPDVVLLTALHLLSFALDICCWQRESGDRLCCTGDSIPILAFADEGVCTRSGDQSLLSLLVSLMRMHRKDKPDNLLEAGGFNLSSLVGSLLKKFAELDSGCNSKLQRLAPEVVNHLSHSGPNGGIGFGGSTSEGDKRKAKARERQAAILEKMRAQQSKFLASINSSTSDGLDGSKIGEAECPSEIRIGPGESTQDVCSLCHDPNSKNPLSFLILLQKSRLLSLVDRGPRSWDQDGQSDKEHMAIHSNKMGVPSGTNPATSSSGLISSSQMNEFIQDVVNEFASGGQPREVNAFLEFIKARFPSVRNIQLPCISNNSRERTEFSLETLEENMYLPIRQQMHDNLFHPNFVEDDQRSPIVEQWRRPESLLLGKYIACLSKQTMENPSPSENSHSQNAAPSESSMPVSSYDGFGPVDCDGIYVSSCGHAVHQACLDRYLSSLKERYLRRIVFEGGQIVDPDQGEFLCPVCRGLANSILPALPGDAPKVFRPPMVSTVNWSDATGHSTSATRETDFRLREAFSLLRSAADVAGRGEILKDVPVHRNGRIRPNLESMFRVLSGMYFPGKQDRISGSARVNHSMIMWDTLKYSLLSTEIAARCGRTSLTPNYGLNGLYKELNSSSGFILSLLLKIVQSTRSKNSLTVFLRLRGIQLFAESVCSGVSLDEFPSEIYGQGGSMLSILKNVETEVPYPDIQFWRRASYPVLSSDAFSTLMWVLFCLPSQFLSCEESFLSLVHLFYAVSVAQAIITYCGKSKCSTTELGCHDGLVCDIFKIVGDHPVAQHYFVSNYIDVSYDVKDIIRRLSFPYLRRCALLWKVMSSSTSAPFGDWAQVYDVDDMIEYADGFMVELFEVEKLEKMFKIPPLDVVLNDEVLRSLVLRWSRHFLESVIGNRQRVLHVIPAVPLKLMHLPHLYQDLLQRYIKQNCPDCGVGLEDPALCLACGKLCSPYWKICCRESECRTHAMACGAGTGAFLLIKKTLILLQRAARQATWPSPYLDAFGEEDIEMHRGKPLYLNEERYAALNHMVASHGLDRSSKVLRQTTIGSLFML